MTRLILLAPFFWRSKHNSQKDNTLNNPKVNSSVQSEPIVVNQQTQNNIQPNINEINNQNDINSNNTN